ncbi:MAG: 8-oxo-dGTP diphosphatase [Candidatus Cloacimonetes bacterium]|nr:8-oxo-dGTP diphosphatase [Candidatus Cloacimonadota bacterium]
MKILATLCYVQDQGKTLMLHRIKKRNDFHKDKWNGLGGKFEDGESPEECVKREILEESGLTIRKPHLHGVITFPNFDGENDWIVFLFTASEFSGTLIDSDEGHLEWISDDKLFDLHLWEGDYIFIKWLKQDKFFSAKFIYEHKRLKNWSVEFY